MRVSELKQHFTSLLDDSVCHSDLVKKSWHSAEINLT